MDQTEIVDSRSKIGYNVDTTHAQDEFIDLVPMPQLNDPDCQHETLVADPEDTLEGAIYHGCSNPKCGIGWYIQNKNIT